MRTITAILLCVSILKIAPAQTPPMLFQEPTANLTHIVFSFAGDLWSVPRAGGDAIRLTTGIGIETDACFSPDGSQIAFTGRYDGNPDVFVMPAAGGVPRRLTYHPARDEVVGWTRDGRRILFRSPRLSNSPVPRLFTVSADPNAGGLPEEVPLPMAMEGSYSPDGARLAYVPTLQFQAAWKRYRGGETKPIWIAQLSDSKIVEKVPRQNSNDFCPMWVGKRIYFLSDRNGPFTLFHYDVENRRVTQDIKNSGLDMKSASASTDGTAIVYEQFGSIHLYDIKSGRENPVNIRLAGDLPEVRPKYEKVAGSIANAALSPTGARAVFEAHGEILTVPAEKGDIRNLTNTPGNAERDPAWSPNGKSIAYFSDDSGEYALHIRSQNGTDEVKKYDLGNPPSFFYSPAWSPDNKKIVYHDKRLNLWYIDLEKKTTAKIDTDTYDKPFHTFDPVWSPDSRWIAYSKQLKSHMGAIFTYSLKDNKTHQITDGLSDARFPVFDKNGKHLYFAASTDVGLGAAWLDMSSIARPVSRSVYVVVLAKDQPSPLAPESDEEKVAPADKPAEKPKDAKEPAETKVDIENIDQRILSLPIPARNYISLMSGKANTLLLIEASGIPRAETPAGMSASKFDLTTRKTDRLLSGISGFTVSFNGEKMLYRMGPAWSIAGTAAAPGPGSGALRTADMEVYVDPMAEWKQMYREVWRIERDFLYDPGLHGLKLAEVTKRYEPYLAGLCSRAGLNYLFEEMLGEITVGHMFIGGGDLPQSKAVPVGLLGADYKVENGRYRFARVYSGENWNPQLRAPLTQPGVNVKAGEYLLAVDGRDVSDAESVYSFFQATAGKQVNIKVGPNPDGAGSREVTVLPVSEEFGLRNLAWIEDNRRMVDKLTGGRIAYVYLPDTSVGGYSNFNRYFFAQVGKEGAIIDERFNGGGSIADYIIDYLRRPLLSFFTTREGADLPVPAGTIQGPKAMIVNEYAGSGGDALPWMFRQAKIGPLIGKRTWGGLVGIYDYPTLIDGGRVTAPRLAFFNLNGAWDVENHGVQPDVEVEIDPFLWRQGHDPQLEKAVEVVMENLKSHPLPKYKKPAYPDYHKAATK